MAEFNKGYANLFNIKDEMDEEEGEEYEDEGEDGGSDNDDDYLANFNKKWGWLRLAIRVKEIKSITLDETYETGIVEFLNLCCYDNDYKAVEKRQQEDYLRKIKMKHK